MEKLLSKMPPDIGLLGVLGRLPSWRCAEHSTKGWAAATLVVCVVSSSAGWLAWFGGDTPWLATALLPLLLWALSPSRALAGWVMACYLAAAGLPVPAAVAAFSEWPWWATTAAQLAYVGLYGTVWGALWGGPGALLEQSAHLAVALTVFTLPPAGTLFYAHPLMAAGVLFPGTGPFGFVLTYACVVSVVGLLQTPGSRLATWCLSLLLLLCLVGHLHGPGVPSSTLRIAAIDTHLPQYPHAIPARHQRHETLIRAAENSMHSSLPPDLVLLPEGVAGLREPRVSWHWSELARTAKAQGITIAVGASVVSHRDAAGKPIHFVNTLELMGAHAGELRAQASVPIGSWKPWATAGHYPERWWTRPDQVMVKNEAIGAILCWEELMLWPWLSHWAEGSQVLLVASNTWFDPSGRIDFAQRRATVAMGALLGFRAVRAANTSGWYPDPDTR